MNLAALHVTNMFNEIFLAYGQSDEYSFVFKKCSNVFNRRSEKILTCKILNNILDVVSAFTSAYVFNWPKVFNDVELKFPPTFDGRVILYPSLQNLKDYFSWRQVDCHINNLYNTTFWALVLIGKLTKEEAHLKLKGTFSKDKHEILHKEYEINYNFIEEVYKRGTIIFKNKIIDDSINLNKKKSKNKKNKVNQDFVIGIDQINLNVDTNLIDEKKQLNEEKQKLILLTDNIMRKDEKYFELLSKYYDQNVFITHEDLIQDEFWKKHNLENN